MCKVINDKSQGIAETWF